MATVIDEGAVRACVRAICNETGCDGTQFTYKKSKVEGSVAEAEQGQTRARAGNSKKAKGEAKNESFYPFPPVRPPSDHTMHATKQGEKRSEPSCWYGTVQPARQVVETPKARSSTSTNALGRSSSDMA